MLVFLMLILFLYSTKLFAAYASSEDEPIYAYLPLATYLYALEELDEQPQEQTPTYTPITMLPPTYFVEVVKIEEEYSLVRYSDLEGYVLTSSIDVCDYEPVTKYALGKAKTSFDGQSVNIRSSPIHTDSDNITISIPSNTDIQYYGTVSGSALFPQIGDTWYYVRYKSGEQTYYGYVYSAQLIVEKISANIIEKVIKLPTDSPTDPKASIEGETPLDLSTSLIITIITIPPVLMILLFFKKPPRKRSSRGT